MMEYEDDEYDQYQQYEDELYKDASEESESSDEVDSELEDNMLAHIHYSTNVYKRVGSNASKSNEGQVVNGSANNTNLTDNHLAASPTAAEDYFKSVNQGNELDSDNDEGIIKASSRANEQTVTATAATGMKGNNQKDIDIDEKHEESRYSVEKKGASKNNWNQHAIAAGNDPNSGTDGEENGSDESDTSDEEGTAGHEKAADGVNFAEEEIELDQHVIDLGAPLDDTQEEANDYDLNAELGHLDDEVFKGHTRYYLESKDRELLCFKCNMAGHMGRDCTTLMCHICGARDDHVSINCPVSACYNCKEKGHISENCPYPRGYGSYQRCERCFSREHLTDDCPTIWREYITTSKEPLQNAVEYCYNCAALGHFGDDCNRSRPQYAKRGGSAFSSQSRARLIFQGSSSPKVDNHNSASKSTSSSSSRHHSSSSRHDSRPDRYDSDHRSSSSRRDRDHSDDHYSSRGGSKPQSYSKDEHRRGDYRDSRSDNHSSRAREEEQRRQRSYRDLDSQGDSGSKYGRDRERDDQEQLNEYAEYNSQQDRGKDRGSKRHRSRHDTERDNEPNNRRESERRTGHSSSSAMAPTTATGASLADNHLGNIATSSSHSRPGTSVTAPIVIADSSSNSTRPQSRSQDASSSNRNKLHHSLPDNPSGRYQGRIPGGDNGSSSRRSFADQNAFPRGHRGNGSTEPNGLIGVPPRPPGPMYTGGYNRRR